ncbi:MAG: peptide ABC transporter permease [Elusimicrobia bacterium RIFCSPLOWO2_01_FULL_59_12]|nr:MAG: peptide ABC transporter permease [Elusimicrobia bacterium RIFCSPLOWO2_01_FULL_59_12]
MLSLYLERFKRNRLAAAGLAIIVLLTLGAALAPALCPQDPTAQNLTQRLQGPSAQHWMGTDDLGRDVFSRLLTGTRVSLSVGFVAVGIALGVGTCLGLLAGFFGGRTDTFIMRWVDIMLSIPTLFLILAVLAFLGPNIYNVMIIIGLTSWPGLTRMVRGECLSVREREYVHAARLSGVSTPRLLFVHILPNVIAPILVSATLGVGGAILTESALSFLGLGVQPPMPSWGNILTIGKDYLHIAWWLSVFPACAILITVLAFNLLGEGLRDVLDPRT